MGTLIPLILLGTAGLVAYWLAEGITKGLPSFTMIYNTACPHCAAILPTFKLFSVPGVATTWVESRWSQIKVSAVPAFIFTDAKGISEFYTGPRDPASWAAFLKTKLNP